ncbi:MAG: hypothetical protein ABIK44_07005 [candidate division WOR-3 bacterium]
MAKEIDRALKRYQQALRFGSGTRRLDDNIEAQVDNYWQGYWPIQLTDSMVKRFLMERGVALTQFVAYANFARRVMRILRRYEAQTRMAEVCHAIDVWERQGLVREVLTMLCREVFDLAVE